MAGARGRVERLRRAPTPTPAPVLSREEPADRGLRAIILDRAGRIDRAKHEEHVGLVEQREGELPPEVAWSCVGRIAPALDVIGEEELDSSAQRALHLARARALW